MIIKKWVREQIKYINEERYKNENFVLIKILVFTNTQDTYM